MYIYIYIYSGGGKGRAKRGARSLAGEERTQAHGGVSPM